jgi:HEAT repeat protein
MPRRRAIGPSRCALILTLAGLAAFSGPAGPACAQQQAAAPGAAQTAALEDYEFGASRAGWTALERELRTADAGRRAAIERRLIEVLREPHATGAATKLACQTLARAGSARCVPALESLLADPEKGDLARCALEALTCPEAGQALCRALPGARGPIKVGIVNSLGARREAGAVPQLVAPLDDADAGVRAAAVAALGRIGTADAAAVLAAAGQRGAPEAEWPHAYLACAYGRLSAGRLEEARAMFRELFARDGRATTRSAALVGLAATEGAEAGPLILSALQAEDPELRLTAARLVVELPGEDATSAFARELPSLPSQAQLVLLGALAERGDPAAEGTVAGLTASEDPAVRKAALEALMAVGTADSVELLASSAAGDEPEVAFRSLAGLDAPGVDEAILRQLSGAPEAVARVLVRALAERGYAAAVPALIGQAESEADTVRREALRALGALAGPARLSQLVELLLAARSAAERAAASAAVVAVCARIQDAGRRTAPLLAAMPGAEVEARCTLLRVLGRLGGEAALRAVLNELDAAEPEVRDAALRALADWHDDAAAQALLEIARAAPAQLRRVLALRGYVRVVRLPSGRPPAQTVRMLRRAMEAADRPEERRLVLSAMAGVSDPAALRYAEQFLGDLQVGAEAHAAVLGVALAVSGACEREARAALELVKEAGPTQQLRDEAAAGLQALDERGDWIGGWMIAGPYSMEGAGPRALFDVPFPPEQAGADGVRWRLAPALTELSAPWLVDIHRVFPRDDSVAYLRTYVRSPHVQEAVLELGSDDGIKAWLNGEIVHANNAVRPLASGEDEADVTLKAGWNTLLLKVTQGGGEWSACARFRAPDGAPLTALRADPGREGGLNPP